MTQKVTAPVGASLVHAAAKAREAAAPATTAKVKANAPPAPAVTAPVAVAAVPAPTPSPQEAATPAGDQLAAAPVAMFPEATASMGAKGRQAAAEMTAIVAECSAAGFPELIAPLMHRGASIQAVRADIERASMITTIGHTLGLSVMASKAVHCGCPVEFFREVAHTVKAAADGAIVTDASHRGYKPSALKIPNAEKIYERMNAPKQPTKKAGG
ncbi:hypothetical protein M0638_20405 [Roseomonas sp. NAR14]|uniref:Uncharacterized protein n=1 Tax=Roseomonas acroporae TaxID=2937791 RepID=A0A9X1YDJ6_9PROT|nr:hypothetical protein [Roseomonas acroporae]MCK8786737.1 hypothetical protein [Roseomonas acroporae]